MTRAEIDARLAEIDALPPGLRACALQNLDAEITLANRARDYEAVAAALALPTQIQTDNALQAIRNRLNSEYMETVQFK